MVRMSAHVAGSCRERHATSNRILIDSTIGANVPHWSGLGGGSATRDVWRRRRVPGPCGSNFVAIWPRMLLPLLPGRPTSHSQSPEVSYSPAVAITAITSWHIAVSTTWSPVRGLRPPSATVAPHGISFPVGLTPRRGALAGNRARIARPRRASLLPTAGRRGRGQRRPGCDRRPPVAHAGHRAAERLGPGRYPPAAPLRG